MKTYLRLMSLPALFLLIFGIHSCNKPDLPELSTVAVRNITAESAIADGMIDSDGGSPILAKGFCWSENPNPTTLDSFEIDLSTSTGAYNLSIEELAPATIYYLRAFATNGEGTAYGNQLAFQTLASFPVVDRDGNGYDTVHIGTQVWMASNLKTTRLNDGTAIPNVSSNSTWTSTTGAAMCWYNNDSVNNKDVYGALYNWNAVNTNKLCPVGWHVPTEAEWLALSTYVGGVTTGGGNLKETGDAHWLSPNLGATDMYGFTALPGGYRSYSNGTFQWLKEQGYFWSSTEYDVASAMARAVYYNTAQIGYGHNGKQYGFSVRCVKNP